MKIVNSEILIPKIDYPTSDYFEAFLQAQSVDFLRWAIVDFDDKNFILNVSHKINS